MARIMRSGKKYQKNFSAKKYGGWPNARKEAIAWIAEIKKDLPSLSDSLYNNMTSRNQSGVVGVSLRRVEMKRASGTYEYWAWVTRWPTCKTKGGVRFNISKGVTDEEAFTKAVLARELQEENRDKVAAEYEKIKGSKKHQSILSKKMLSLE